MWPWALVPSSWNQATIHDPTQLQYIVFFGAFLDPVVGKYYTKCKEATIENMAPGTMQYIVFFLGAFLGLFVGKYHN
jgi:hypothetical protein